MKKNERIDLQFLKDNIKYILLLFNLFIIILTIYCILKYKNSNFFFKTFKSYLLKYDINYHVISQSEQIKKIDKI